MRGGLCVQLGLGELGDNGHVAKRPRCQDKGSQHAFGKPGCICHAPRYRVRSSMPFRPNELLLDFFFDYLEPSLSANSPALEFLSLTLELTDLILRGAQFTAGFLQHGDNGQFLTRPFPCQLVGVFLVQI